MIANLFRLFLGLLLLPACWGITRTLIDAIGAAAARTGLSVESLSILGGVAAFTFSWMALSRPVKAYVLGHELTHALWGVIFFARPSDLKVGADGGSVRLSKTNMLITLAPYFFPFYTFVVIVCALVTAAFMRPLPCLPLWLFLIGFTWAFHVLFTIQTLGTHQPDVKTYGRIFSWTFIFLVNIAIVLVWLATMTPLTFAALWDFLVARMTSAYVETWLFLWHGIQWIVQKCSRT